MSKVDYDKVIREWKAIGVTPEFVLGYVQAISTHVSPRWADAINSCYARVLTEAEKVWIRQVEGKDYNISDNVETRVWVSFWRDKGPESLANRDSHVTHCCVDHGCKYGDDKTCPVANGEKRQDYLCPYCSLDGEGW